MTRTSLARIPRDLVVVSGPDASSFLQSLLSQDLDAVPAGAVAHALLLQPQGKLVVDLRAAHVDADSWWCVCEGGFGDRLADGLRRFRIRVKVDLEDRSAASAAVALHGPDALQLARDADAGLVWIPAEWSGVPGVELVGEASAVDAAAAAAVAAGAVEIDDWAYEELRIEAGVPRQGYDTDETTIAQEAFLERDAVSFSKGCFLGQELVCRIDTRGHVNRLLRRLRADVPLARGSVVVTAEREVGSVTSAAGRVALALLRREVEPGDEVRLRAAGPDVDTGAVTARVEAIVAE